MENQIGQRIEYSNELSKPKENKINIIHNAINFGIEKIIKLKVKKRKRGKVSKKIYLNAN